MKGRAVPGAPARTDWGILRHRCPAKRHSTHSAWIPIGVSGRNGVFQGGGVQFYGARGRFAGLLSVGKEIRRSEPANDGEEPANDVCKEVPDQVGDDERRK